MRVRGEGAAVDHGGLKVCALRVLPLSFVSVLVAAQGLRSGEVSAAVVAFEPAAALSVVVVVSAAVVCVVILLVVVVKLEQCVVDGGGGCFR